MKHYKVEMRRTVEMFGTTWVSAENEQQAQEKAVASEVDWDWESCDADTPVVTHVMEDEDEGD